MSDETPRKRRRFWPEHAFLRSKVGRRIFALFVLCALVPLTLLAIVSYWQVISQLNRQADERLRQACRALGMTLVERIAIAESDLIDSFYPGSADSPLSPKPTLERRSPSRLKWMALQSEDGRILAHSGSGAEPFRPTAGEWRYLEGSKVLLASRAGPDRILLVTRWPRDAVVRTLLVGEVNPSYLFGGEDLLPVDTQLAVLTRSRHVIFSSRSGMVPVGELERAVSLSSEAGGFEWERSGDPHVAVYWTVFMDPMYGDSWIVLLSMRRDDVLAPLRSFTRLFILITLLSLWIVAFLSVLQIRRSTAPIEQLRDATRKMTNRDFGARVRIKTRDELEELGESVNTMAESLGAHVATMETVNSIGKSLTAERQEGRLLKTIVLGTKKLLRADGGALYLFSADHRYQLALLEIDSLHLKVESGRGDQGEAPLPLLCPAWERKWITLDSSDSTDLDLHTVSGYGENGQSEFDRRTGYLTRSWLSVPLRNHENELIGILQLINAVDSPDAAVRPFSLEEVRLAESLASQAAVALTKNRLVQEFQELFEGLTRLIATAVDAKSTYTADHSERVFVLTGMIAEAACKADEGPLKDFSLTEEEMYELGIAARLHDCGKVATPVHIADKATKLETIVDRIELIETRLEIIRRDREIELLREKLNGSGNGSQGTWLAEIDSEMERFTRQLRRDMEFLRTCNRGSEYMPDSARQKVRAFAEKYHWLSASNKREAILRADEVENLTIVRGTLNEAERRVINAHVDVTFRMLKSLRYPRNLKNVPMHASTHHERMDGRGYPFGLHRDQISSQGKIIGLADVFEALTSKDRPYKPCKSLSEALTIMQAMKKEGQIDPDLYDIFIKERIYLRYAREYLDPAQITEVSFLPVDNLLGSTV